MVNYMAEPLVFHFEVDGDNFTSAGQASVQVKKNLRELGVDPETIRRVSIAMYEGEINMVIHAGMFGPFYIVRKSICSHGDDRDGSGVRS